MNKRKRYKRGESRRPDQMDGVTKERNASRRSRQGFTLVEMLMALSISVLVFAAMGVLLVRTTRLWIEGAAHWHLAHQARAARARMIHGMRIPGVSSDYMNGLLQLSEIEQIQINPQWCIFRYSVAGGGHNERFTLRGSVFDSDKRNRQIFIQRNPGGGNNWLMMAATVRGADRETPDIEANTFRVGVTNRVLHVHYTLRFEAAGRQLEMPQELQIYMVNNR